MTLPANTSQTARLMLGGLGFQVGWQEQIFVPNPAAGTVWSHTVDGRYFERLLTVRYQFQASAAVGNRFLEVALTDVNGKVITTVPAGFSISAGQQCVTNLHAGGPAYDTTGQGDGFGFLPDVLAPPGWTWTGSAVGLDVADQYSAVTLLVQKFPNDAAMVDVTP